MKRAFSFIMTIVFSLVFFQQAVIIVYFKLNQLAIEQEFCVNKDKLELQCHGKCHLKKDLEQTQKSDLESVNFNKKMELVLISRLEVALAIFIEPIQRRELVYRELAHAEPCLKIVSPPPIATIVL